LSKTFGLCALGVIGSIFVAGAQAPEGQARPRLVTRWAADVKPDNVWPEYPRPQLVRPAWQNLNGSWQYAITAREATPASDAYRGTILVPFAIESYLSGVRAAVTPEQHLWYRRTFKTPDRPSGGRVLLHFGAVDWEAVVAVNGKPVGEHRGGYDPFTFDITDALRPGSDQEIVVRVWDPTDKGPQPRGKQVLKPHSIWYTAVTGIWQTVWLEAVPASYIAGLRIDPDVDAGVVRVSVDTIQAPSTATVRVDALDGSRQVGTATGRPGDAIAVRVPNAKLWSPSDPFLYDLSVHLSTGDTVKSYFGMRKIAVGPDERGINRLQLNGKVLFQFGQLDQGWWPDGLYTAPTDAALRFDIEAQKSMGFNTIRKHVKVEPARWYFDCDRLGMLVWQDMPSGDNNTPDGVANFGRELEHVIGALRNHPSIVMWVPFNEGWGQHETEKYVARLKAMDPTRLVNNTSGWNDAGVGDIVDGHAYPGPAGPAPDSKRAAVIGEFGGLGLPIEGHTWLEKGNWGYRSFTTPEDLGKAYRDLTSQLRLQIARGAAAAIYTQTTDVEIEVNGLMTYDRAVTKIPATDLAAWHSALFSTPPTLTTIVPIASPDTSSDWSYSTAEPASGWMRPDFDASQWWKGPGGFGRRDTRWAHVGTEWTTNDLWLRRPFDLPSTASPHPHLEIFHDDAAEVYVNGELAATLPGATGGYMFVPLNDAAARTLHAGTNTLAVHVHQDRGGQFIDVGIVDVADEPKAARPRIVGIDHVAFRASDVAASRRFYGGTLGLSEAGWACQSGIAFLVGPQQRIVIEPGLPAGENERLSHLAYATPDVKALSAYLSARGVKVQPPAERCEESAIRVSDPDGHAIEFVQVDWPPSAVAPREGTALSQRILHTGLTVRDEQLAHTFYKDVLGFSEIWRGGRPEGVTQWVNMRVPDGTEYLEYMLSTSPPDRRQLGAMHHVALLVPDMETAWEDAVRRSPEAARLALSPPAVGVNGRWQLNLYDPDGTRVELMEPFRIR